MMPIIRSDQVSIKPYLHYIKVGKKAPSPTMTIVRNNRAFALYAISKKFYLFICIFFVSWYFNGKEDSRLKTTTPTTLLLTVYFSSEFVIGSRTSQITWLRISLSLCSLFLYLNIIMWQSTSFYNPGQQSKWRYNKVVF